MVGAIAWSFLCPDAETAFQVPSLARIFFWHFPCPMMQLGFMFVGAFCALMFFRTPTSEARQRMIWDSRAEAAVDLSGIFTILTMLSGMVFSKAEWGDFWSWDPRQYSYIAVILIMLAYFVVRAAFPDPEARASHSAAYILTAVLPVLFLVYVFPHIPSIEKQSLHPSDTIISGQLKGVYAYVTIFVLTLVTWLCVWLYRMRVRVNLMEFELGQLEIPRHAAGPVPVVRPVSVSHADGEKD